MEVVKVKRPQEMLMLTPQNPSQAKPSKMLFAKDVLKKTQKQKNTDFRPAGHQTIPSLLIGFTAWG